MISQNQQCKTSSNDLLAAPCFGSHQFQKFQVAACLRSASAPFKQFHAYHISCGLKRSLQLVFDLVACVKVIDVPGESTLGDQILSTWINLVTGIYYGKQVLAFCMSKSRFQSPSTLFYHLYNYCKPWEKYFFHIATLSLSEPIKLSVRFPSNYQNVTNMQAKQNSTFLL